MSHALSTSELETLATDVYADYTAQRGPFAEYDLPEYEVLDDIPAGRDRANFITLVASINLAIETSGGDGLWQTARDLYHSDDDGWLFEPDKVSEKSIPDLYQGVFRKADWQHENVPAFWRTNARTIAEQFDGDIRHLLAQCDYDAVEILRFVQDERPAWFPSLKGPKVSALWLRLLDEEVHALDNIAAIDIPADRNILRVTNYLVADDLADRTDANLTTARETWTEVCRNTELVPVRLDKPLWLCGKGSRYDHLDYWETWGRDYLDSKVP